MRQRPITERMSGLQQQRIEALRQTKAQLEARQAAVERKRQERRRYLQGSFLLERLGQDGPWRELVWQEFRADAGVRAGDPSSHPPRPFVFNKLEWQASFEAFGEMAQ